MNALRAVAPFPADLKVGPQYGLAVVTGAGFKPVTLPGDSR